MIQPVITTMEQYLTDNAALVVGSAWVVLLLFCFAMLPGGERSRNQSAFLVILLGALPVLFVNSAWWALTVYFFYLLYSVINAFRALGK